MDDLGQILFFLVIAVLWLLGAVKKKKKVGPKRQAAQAKQGSRPRINLEELERMLREPERALERIEGAAEPAEESEPPPAEPPPTAPREASTAWAEGLERRPRSEETDGSHVASHQRFHDRYVKPLKPITAAPGPVHLSAGGLRNAVIWREILGPPVSRK